MKMKRFNRLPVIILGLDLFLARCGDIDSGDPTSPPSNKVATPRASCRKRGQLLRNSFCLCGGHKKMSEKSKGVLHVEEKTFRNDGPIG
jgi:hypothetical protein